MDVASRIKARRTQLGLTLEEVGNAVGVGKSTVRKWESGVITRIGSDKIDLLARALKVTPAELMGWEESSSFSLPSNVRRISGATVRTIPMLGEIAAGRPIMALQEYEYYVDCPAKADFALTVRGDSMQPTYLDGDVVYIRAQDDVDDSQVAAVIIDDHATLKHVYHIPNGLMLISDNPAYPPLRMTCPEHESIRILGLVVGFTRMYGNPLSNLYKGIPVD